MGNYTAETAFVLGYGYIQQDPNDSPGPNHDVWVRYNPKVNDLIIGVKLETLNTVDPPAEATMTAYHGDPDALSPILSTNASHQFTVPTDLGGPIYLRYRDPTPTAGLIRLTIIPPPYGTAPIGSLIIPDDDAKWPAAVISSSTGAIIGYLRLPAGEGGEILPNGKLLMHDVSDGSLKLWASDAKTLLATVPTVNSAASGVWTGHPPITSNRIQTFYAADGNATLSTRVYRVTDAGVKTGEWDLPYPYNALTLGSADGVLGIGASPDGTILYILGFGLNVPVRRWDLVNDVGLSDLSVGIAGARFGQDLLMLSDGSFIVAYSPTGADDFVKRYSSTGTLLNTYTIPPVGAFTNIEHMTRAVTDAAFVVWQQEANIHTVRFVRVSDGVILQTIQFPVFDVGVAASGTLPGNFGVSSSCPIIVTTISISTTPPTVGPPTTTNPCECTPVPPTTPPTPQPPPTPPNPPPQEPHIGEQLACMGGGFVPIQADFPPQELWWGL